MELLKKVNDLQLIVYDFDGVMTDNKVYIDEDGREQVCVNRGDGFAIGQIKEMGIHQIILSTEQNKVVGKRGDKLGIEVIQGVGNKRETLVLYCNNSNVDLRNVLYIGNDLNDYEVLQAVGIKGCPADADVEIIKLCDWVSDKKGGQGVIRDLYAAICHYKQSFSKKIEFQQPIVQKMLAAIVKGETFAIIPARSGSKGIPDKNIKNLYGFPLIAYTIAAAELSVEISRTIISTDSDKYAEIARQYGAEVPFLRPKEISQDDSTDFEFVQHAISWLYEHEGKIPEYFAHLRVTSPLRNPSVVDEAIRMIKEKPEASSLRSAVEEKSVIIPYKWFKKEGEYYQSIFFEDNESANLPRQSYPKAYMPTSYVDILKSETIIKYNMLHGNKILAFESPQIEDIDELKDFEGVEKNFSKDKDLYHFLLRKRNYD